MLSRAPYGWIISLPEQDRPRELLQVALGGILSLASDEG
ncbi:hypothetical protein EN925_22845 [Mesorhizobium sp. M7A.F.Ca.US.006.04.2.1]|nr:hypothetical protein EN990_27180 [Mesorhizobium sp. M7A.F.Ca.US.005.03.1.1]RUY11583.1 hypothetical protein EN991_25120 [Mesorhizobium sp. M7A.F.Ca.US.005.03.2.1]RVA87112.1 hypothetical protein EN925_22845 [Mesorhizobium sp. M7A.F.Ca.US.006.04.2.1]